MRAEEFHDVGFFRGCTERDVHVIERIRGKATFEERKGVREMCLVRYVEVPSEMLQMNHRSEVCGVLPRTPRPAREAVAELARAVAIAEGESAETYR